MAFPSIMLELILVRHGQTQWNAEHRYLGHTNLPLLPSALEQLSQLKRQFSQLTEKWGEAKQEADGCEYHWQASDSALLEEPHFCNGGLEQTGIQRAESTNGFWRVFCSDLLRCRETLAYISPSLEEVAVYDQRLREMNFGAFEGCSYEELKDNTLYRSWIDNPSTVTPPDGEPWAQFDERLHSFLSDLGRAAEATFVQAARNKNKDEVTTNRVLVVTHGGVIRNFLAQLVPEVTFYNAAAPSPGTAMILKILWQNGRWSADISKKG